MLPAILFGVGLTVAIELLCCLFRFAFGLRSRVLQRKWLGVRIHHGYVGVALLPLLFFLSDAARPWVGATAAALVLSDLFHHFVVLRLVTGRFD